MIIVIIDGWEVGGVREIKERERERGEREREREREREHCCKIWDSEICDMKSYNMHPNLVTTYFSVYTHSNN